MKHKTSRPAQMLATIESSHIPISTPELQAIHYTGTTFPRSRVWAALRKLEKHGLIRKCGRVPGARGNQKVLWTSANPVGIELKNGIRRGRN